MRRKNSYSIFRNITTIWNNKGYGLENKLFLTKTTSALSLAEYSRAALKWREINS